MAKRQILINNLKNNPCMDCGKIFNPWVMEFDHRPGTIKRFCISSQNKQGSVSLRTLKQEIVKCDLVCSNCHQDRTYKRKHPNV